MSIQSDTQQDSYNIGEEISNEFVDSSLYGIAAFNKHFYTLVMTGYKPSIDTVYAALVESCPRLQFYTVNMSGVELHANASAVEISNVIKSILTNEQQI